ncbi:fluoride efflux transporter CrcB [Sphaerotilaceae bacterium SBD11-9]
MSPNFPYIQILAVAVGASVGAVLRWATGLWLNVHASGFAYGTLAVNCVGGLLIGMAIVWFDRSPNELLRLMLVTGFLGGLTTFSAFSGESLGLLQRGDYAWALAHTLSHVLGSLVCAAAGFRLMRIMLA